MIGRKWSNVEKAEEQATQGDAAGNSGESWKRDRNKWSPIFSWKVVILIRKNVFSFYIGKPS